MKRLIATSLFAMAVAMPAVAQVRVDDPWVRATVPHQRATGAFMQLTAPVDARVVEVRSPVAAVVEVHEMRMEGDVMKMRAVQALELPAGRMVELKPGGYHIMLLDLKSQVKEGEVVPVTLIVEDKDGQRETVAIEAPVRSLTQGHSPKQHGHGH
ncbi:MAG TPA: copper chaperone PCu(A)C [Rhodocyclaceae bacterium]|nr:copper chaperone PCu(A)C [Rhodocyclaceae bacterium]